MDLPKVAQGDLLGVGNSIPCIMFEENGEAVCVRMGRIANDKITMWISKGIITYSHIAAAGRVSKRPRYQSYRSAF